MDEDIMRCLGETDELSVFSTESVIQLLEFKWNGPCGYLHTFGSINHFFYMAIFSMFVNVHYVYTPYYDYDYPTLKPFLLLLLLLSLIYPCIYDMMQLKIQGTRVYLSDKWNYCDQIHIWGGFINVVTHLGWVETDIKFKETLLIVLCVIMLLKSFFFLRIFRSSSQLVMMMIKVA